MVNTRSENVRGSCQENDLPNQHEQEIQRLNGIVKQLRAQNEELIRCANLSGPTNTERTLTTVNRTVVNDASDSAASLQQSADLPQHTDFTSPRLKHVQEAALKEVHDKLNQVLQQVNNRGAGAMATLVQKTDLPFTPRVMTCLLPAKFKLPSLDPFDGTNDPLDHLEAFKAHMTLHAVPDEIMCRTFPITLKDSARIWFGKLSQTYLGTIDDFSTLSRLFVEHFYSGCRQPQPATYLLNVKQSEDESLRSYMKRFNDEVLLVDEIGDKVALTAFMSGLQPTQFFYRLSEKPPNSMAELMHKAQKHMNAEDAMAARKKAPNPTKKRSEPDRVGSDQCDRLDQGDRKFRLADRSQFRESF